MWILSNFISFAIPIILIIQIVILRGRVKALESRMMSIQTEKDPVVVGTTKQPEPQFIPAQNLPNQPVSQNGMPAMQMTVASQYTQPSTTSYYNYNTKPNPFFEWLKKDWLLKIGAFFVLLGFVWLATFAFMQGWIDERGRITLGILVGLGVLIFGWFRIATFKDQGSVFMVLGSGGIIASVTSGYHLYNLFHPAVALGAMFLCAVFLSLSSVRFKVPALSVTGLAVAVILPILLGLNISEVFLFSYLLIITVSSLGLITLTKNRTLLLESLLIYLFYSLAFMGTQSLLIFAFIFAILFLASNLYYFKKNQTNTQADIYVAAGNGLLLLVWILSTISTEWMSLVIATWMLVFITSAFFVYRFSRNRIPFYVYFGLSIIMLAVATVIELDWPGLTFALLLEALLIIMLVHTSIRNFKLTDQSTLLLAVPALLALGSLGSGA